MYKVGSRHRPGPFERRATGGGWRQAGLRRVPWPTLAVIAAGGVIGALARQGLWAEFPHRAGAFDWTTLSINAAGCTLIGILMTASTEIRHSHRLTGPFLGIGVLGGFTTFSTYIVEIQQSITKGAPGTGLAYLAATLAAASLGVCAGVTATRLLSRQHRKERGHEAGRPGRAPDRAFLPQLDELVTEGPGDPHPVEVIRYVGRPRKNPDT